MEVAAMSDKSQASARLPALPEVTIYVDGSCSENPGKGGYGVVLLCGDQRRELSQGFRMTTSNRMELMGAIAGLERLNRPCRITVISDSEYLVKAMRNGWTRRWKANGWRKQDNGRVLNVDLWERLLAACEAHEVEFRWVRGHSGDTENERCDGLAKAAQLTADLAEDEGYRASKRAGGAAQEPALTVASPV
jgi:ribonuclease HI